MIHKAQSCKKGTSIILSYDNKAVLLSMKSLWVCPYFPEDASSANKGSQHHTAVESWYGIATQLLQRFSPSGLKRKSHCVSICYTVIREQSSQGRQGIALAAIPTTWALLHWSVERSRVGGSDPTRSDIYKMHRHFTLHPVPGTVQQSLACMARIQQHISHTKTDRKPHIQCTLFSVVC